MLASGAINWWTLGKLSALQQAKEDTKCYRIADSARKSSVSSVDMTVKWCWMSLSSTLWIDQGFIWPQPVGRSTSSLDRQSNNSSLMRNAIAHQISVQPFKVDQKDPINMLNIGSTSLKQLGFFIWISGWRCRGYKSRKEEEASWWFYERYLISK